MAVFGAGLTLFFAGTDPASQTASDPVRGNWIALVSGVFWACTILGLRWLASKPRDEGDPAGAAIVAGNILACVLTAPFALRGPAPTAFDLGVVAYLGIFQIGLAYVCMTRGMRGVRALEAVLLLLLEPVLNAVWAWIVHGERPGTWSLAGCSVILAATAAQAVRRERQ
jgi:drug/metabolite transporter (DMT)-like permease